jgi:NAD(P)-dependent dehydrogenase (short-subunit alcohol dehydrogenase family)
MYKKLPSLAGKTAIVTGSAQGIGKAIADCYAEFGAKVVLVDIQPGPLKQAEAAIRKAGGTVLALQKDVRKQADVDAIFSATVKKFGGVDILVNNVGWTKRKLFMEMTDDEWMEAIDVNLVQAMRCTRAAAKVMIAKKTKGSIVNVTTIEGFRAAPGFAPYAAAKAGLTNFTKTLALELSPWGIRVNAIAPDATVTPRILEMRPDWAKSSKPPHIPMGRRGQIEDHAGAALYLASAMSSWVTGETLHVGGGTYAASGWRLTSSGHWSTDGINAQVYSGKPFKP